MCAFAFRPKQMYGNISKLVTNMYLLLWALDARLEYSANKRGARHNCCSYQKKKFKSYSRIPV